MVSFLVALVALIGYACAFKVTFGGDSTPDVDGWLKISPGSLSGTVPTGETVTLSSMPTDNRINARGFVGDMFVKGKEDIPDFGFALFRFQLFVADLGSNMLMQGVEHDMKIELTNLKPATPYKCTLYWLGGLFPEERQFDIARDGQNLFGAFKPNV